MNTNTITKLRTADCIKNICEEYKGSDNYLTNPKNWKRVTKKGNSKKGYLREFRNKEDDEIRVFIKSTESTIISLTTRRTPFNILNYENKPTQESQTGFYNLLRTILSESGKQYSCGGEGHLNCGDIVYGLTFENLPQVNGASEGEEPEMEEVDFENYEILEVTPNTITISAGGDWQNPETFTAEYRDGKMYVISHHPTTDWREGLDLRTIITQVYGDPSPSELKHLHKRERRGTYYV